MHVVYLIDSLVPAGAERSLLALAPEYARLGVRLDVLYLHERPGLQADLVAAGARVERVAPRRSGPLGAVLEIRRLVVGRSPDLLHTTLFEADVLGRTASIRTGIPSVTSLVSDSYGPGHVGDPRLVPWKVRGAQALDAITARQASRFHAITDYVATVGSERLRIPRHLIDVIPRGRSATALGIRSADRRRAARADLGVDTGRPLVVAAARHEHQKGLDLLIAALEPIRTRHPDVRLVIAGREGHQSAQLRGQVSSLGLDEHVCFLGVRDDVPELLCAADVFVLPSRWEGLGGVLLEAMALEAPIVASDLPAVREVLQNRATGLLVASSDAAALGDAILEAIDDRTNAALRAEAARTVFLQRFTIDRIAREMVAFYARALVTR